MRVAVVVNCSVGLNRGSDANPHVDSTGERGSFPCAVWRGRGGLDSRFLGPHLLLFWYQYPWRRVASVLVPRPAQAPQGQGPCLGTQLCPRGPQGSRRPRSVTGTLHLGPAAPLCCAPGAKSFRTRLKSANHFHDCSLTRNF